MIGCYRYTGTPIQNGVVTVCSNEIMPLQPDSISFRRIHEGEQPRFKYVRLRIILYCQLTVTKLIGYLECGTPMKLILKLAHQVTQ